MHYNDTFLFRFDEVKCLCNIEADEPFCLDALVSLVSKVSGAQKELPDNNNNNNNTNNTYYYNYYNTCM